MTKKYLSIIALLIAIIAIIFWVNSDKAIAPTNQPTENLNQESTDELDESTYQVDNHGFSFELPKDLEVEEYNENQLAIGTKEDEVFNSSVEITVMEKTDDFSNVEQFIIKEFIKNCGATGAGLTIKCTQVDEYRDFTNNNNFNGFSFYLKQETSSILDDIVEVDSKGPFYAFELNNKIIIIHPPINQIANQSDVGLIEKIANSFNQL